MEKFKVDFSVVNALKICSKNDIDVLDIKKIDLNHSEISINKIDRKKFTKVFSLNKIKISFKVLVPILFCIIFVSSLIFCNQFVFKIEVVTTNQTVKNETLKALKPQIKPFTKKSLIDVNSIKQNLMQNEKIALVDVKIVGLVLYVSIKENDSIPENNFIPILSTVDGIVESVNLISGTAKVVKGSAVRIGDILIKPEIVNEGVSIKTKAIGQVVILAYTQKKVVFAENKVEYSHTGKFVKQKYFTFFGNCVKMKTEVNNFSSFERELKVSRTKIGFIPIKLYEEIFYETERIESFVDFEKNKANILKESIENLKVQVGKDFAYYSENATYKFLGDGEYEITVTVQYPILIV